MSSDVERLLEKLTKGRGGNGDGEGGSNDMTEQEQADQLLDFAAEFHNPVDFKVGNLVRYRKDTSSVIRRGNRLHIVVGYIDPPIKIEITTENEGSPTAYRTYDIIVAVTDHTKRGSVLKYPTDRRELELWPEGERLKRKDS